MFKVKTSVEFDGAHFLEGTNTECDSLHGHRWKVWLTLKSEELNNKGFVINFTIVKKWLEEVIKKYDHNLLNYYLEQPTAENLAFSIWRNIRRRLWDYNKYHSLNVIVESVEMFETPNNSASFILNDINVKKESSRRTTFNTWDNEEKRNNIMEGLRKANKDPILRKLRSDRMKESNPMSSRKNVEKMLQSLKKSNKQCPNEEEKKVIDFFKQNNIPLNFVGNGEFILAGKIPDFVDYDKKLIVEYNNRFWHSDNNKWYDVKDDSESRIELFKKFGYNTYIIWSDEFKNNPNKILKEIKEYYKI